MKAEEVETDEIYKMCRQQHPIYFFNNIGLVHLKLKKYSMASFYFTKSLKYLSKDGRQPEPVVKPLEYLTNHVS